MNRSASPRILHLASGDLWAGAESQLFTLVTTLNKSLDITVFVVLLNFGTLEHRLRKAGIEVIVLDESKLNSIQILRKLIRVIKKRHPDLVHTHRIKENILGSTAALFSGRILSVRTVHGAPENPPSWRQISKRIIWSLDRLSGYLVQDRIIAVSDELAVKLKYDFPSEKVHVIENGIDIESIRKQTSVHTTVVPVNTNTFRIGLAGRLVAVKRVDLFIKTARYLLDHYPNFQTSFHIIGEGPLRHELENLSHEQRTDEIVQFEGYREDITRRLMDLDILLMTSDHEGLPMILLEAMALNVPIIAHAVGGIPKLLDQGSCGVLVNEQNPAEYAEQIFRLCSSSQARVENAKNALARVNHSYSAIRNARSYLSEYGKLLKATHVIIGQ